MGLMALCTASWNIPESFSRHSGSSNAGIFLASLTWHDQELDRVPYPLQRASYGDRQGNNIGKLFTVSSAKSQRLPGILPQIKMEPSFCGEAVAGDACRRRHPNSLHILGSCSLGSNKDFLRGLVRTTRSLAMAFPTNRLLGTQHKQF